MYFPACLCLAGAQTAVGKSCLWEEESEEEEEEEVGVASPKVHNRQLSPLALGLPPSFSTSCPLLPEGPFLPSSSLLLIPNFKAAWIKGSDSSLHRPPLLLFSFPFILLLRDILSTSSTSTAGRRCLPVFLLGRRVPLSRGGGGEGTDCGGGG